MNVLDAIPLYASTHGYGDTVRGLYSKCVCRNVGDQRDPFRIEDGGSACS